MTIEVLEAQKRPVSAVADHTQIDNVIRVEIAIDRSVDLVMMHDPGHSLDERIPAGAVRILMLTAHEERQRSNPGATDPRIASSLS